MDNWQKRGFFYGGCLKIKKVNMKKMKKILGKSFKIVLFIIATILWSLFVYSIGGEWLYFIPLIVGDILFWETIS